MDNKKINIKKLSVIVLVLYFIITVVFYNSAGEQLDYKKENSNMISPLSPIGEISKNMLVEQNIIVNADYINSVTLFMANYGRQNGGNLNIAIYNKNEMLGKTSVSAENVLNNSPQTFTFEKPIKNTEGSLLTIRIWSEDCELGSAVTVMYGNFMNTLKGQVTPELEEWQKVRLNGEPIEGQLCYQIESTTRLWYGKYYWVFAIVTGVLLCIYLYRLLYLNSQKKTCLGLKLIDACNRYSFLIAQLVLRDFKTKYKRSILGIFWSFLNPLLTMVVQFFVFSNIFKSDTENFVVYLLVGIVFFNFYAEASNMAMSSIVGNSALITKVYVPKYIYPLSRVLSSLINFLISLIPLVFMIIATQVQITSAILLVIYPMICTLLLSIGMGLILSAIMVFFRDTQFIYGVFLTAMMYFTPIFYPISIIPEKYIWLFSLNPISNNIIFARTCILEGIFPGMELFFLCGIYSIVILIIGAYVFKKNQDKFILHI